MPRQLSMSYVSSQRRWTKKYKGRIYSVSCKQLGCPAGKEASSVAANAWWEKKQAQIDSEEKQGYSHPRSEAIVEAMEQNLGVTFATSEEAGQAFMELMLHHMGEGQHLPDWFHEAVLGPERLEQFRQGLGAMAGHPVLTERSIGQQVEQWLTVLRVSVSQKLMDEGRYDAYQRHIKIFERWLGTNTLVDLVNASKLEEWWAYLSLKVGEGAYSPSYARTIFMTTKQFISRLGELGLIPLPGNIRSRRFKFGDGPKAVDRLTIEEVKAMLAGCVNFSERTKLFLLLMLNCGMYQSDISDIGQDEVDWAKGTLSRPRSKTPKGPRVTYKLWPETLKLLRKFRAEASVPNDRGQSRVLLTEDDKPLVLYWLENEKMRRYDCIHAAFSRLCEKVKMKKPIKLLRKTSASELASHSVYGAYVQYFLAHSPKGVADRHYIKPDDAQFFEALDWLRKRYGL
jgi:integrase